MNKQAGSDSEINSSSSSDAESIGRVLTVGTANEVNKKEQDMKANVSVRRGGDRIGVVWTADSGVKKTLLAEKDWVELRKKNQV